jgi:predicted nucleotidyltransferase
MIDPPVVPAALDHVVFGVCMLGGQEVDVPAFRGLRHLLSLGRASGTPRVASMGKWSLSTADPAVDALLVSIREAITTGAGSALVGLYVFGSLAEGDFDPAVSDIDLIAVLTESPNEQLATRLGRMHDDLARSNPEWDDRIEVIYISRFGLANCRRDTTKIAVISPGEPFHVVEAGRDWILNWYPARERGVMLTGPPIDSLIPPITDGEYIDEVRRSLIAFTNRIPDDAPLRWRAYAILTMCRGLYAIRFGERLSKREAATWAQREFPKWADLIRRAVGWRERQWPDGGNATVAVSETRAFVAQMAELGRA